MVIVLTDGEAFRDYFNIKQHEHYYPTSCVISENDLVHVSFSLALSSDYQFGNSLGWEGVVRWRESFQKTIISIPQRNLNNTEPYLRRAKFDLSIRDEDIGKENSSSPLQLMIFLAFQNLVCILRTNVALPCVSSCLPGM